MMYFEVIKSCQFYKTITITKIVDGDGFYGVDFNGKLEEYRLIGIDAPELKKCKKLKNDEIELQIPGQLLQELAVTSSKYLQSILPIKSKCDLFIEPKTEKDQFNRTLIYAFLSPKICINEQLINEGIAKAYTKRNCLFSAHFKHIEMLAKLNKKGHFQIVNRF